MKNNQSDLELLLLDCYYLDETSEDIKSKSILIFRKELGKNCSNIKNLYQQTIGKKFTETCSSYRISEIKYHFGYQIMEYQNKWMWNFCVFIEENKELNISETYFTRESGICDSESQAYSQAHDIIQTYMKHAKEKQEE